MRIRHCIVDEGSSTSILSSSTWKYFGAPKLVSTTSELLDFAIEVLHGSLGLPHDMLLRKISLSLS
jgi:hypothetical protein